MQPVLYWPQAFDKVEASEMESSSGMASWQLEQVESYVGTGNRNVRFTMSDLLSVQGPEFPIGKLSESKTYTCTLWVYFFIVASVKLDSSFESFFLLMIATFWPPRSHL